LCGAAEATGTIKFYDVIKGFGVVVGKDQKESFIHHSQITDIGPLPTKLTQGTAVEFDVQTGERGLVARNVRRAA